MNKDPEEELRLSLLCLQVLQALLSIVIAAFFLTVQVRLLTQHSYGQEVISEPRK